MKEYHLLWAFVAATAVLAAVNLHRGDSTAGAAWVVSMAVTLAAAEHERRRSPV